MEALQSGVPTFVPIQTAHHRALGVSPLPDTHEGDRRPSNRLKKTDSSAEKASPSRVVRKETVRFWPTPWESRQAARSGRHRTHGHGASDENQFAPPCNRRPFRHPAETQVARARLALTLLSPLRAFLRAPTFSWLLLSPGKTPRVTGAVPFSAHESTSQRSQTSLKKMLVSPFASA